MVGSFMRIDTHYEKGMDERGSEVMLELER